MIRKVIQQGPNTLGVSLPSKWIKEHGIKKGDDINIDQLESDLIIGSKNHPISETKIHIPTQDIPLDKEKNPNRYIVRAIIINALRKGHDKIRVTFDSPKSLKAINSCVDEVLGYDITEQSSNYCIIENIVELKDNDFHKQLTKFRHVIINFSDLIQENIINNKKNLEEINSTFISVEKNYNTFCSFLLNKLQSKTKEKLFLFNSIEHLYQATRNMFYAAKLNIPLSKSGTKYAKDVFNYVNQVIDFIAKKDLTKILDLNLLKNKLTYHTINNLICKNQKENPTLLQLSFVARRCWDAVSPYTASII